MIGLFALLYGYFFSTLLMYFVRQSMNMNPMQGPQSMNINQQHAFGCCFRTSRS